MNFLWSLFMPVSLRADELDNLDGWQLRFHPFTSQLVRMWTWGVNKCLQPKMQSCSRTFIYLVNLKPSLLKIIFNVFLSPIPVKILSHRQTFDCASSWTRVCWDNIVPCLLALAFGHVGGPPGRRRRPGPPSWRPERADDTDSHLETQQK